MNCWLGLVFWTPGIPIWKGLLRRGRIPNHRAPNSRLATSWWRIPEKLNSEVSFITNSISKSKNLFFLQNVDLQQFYGGSSLLKHGPFWVLGLSKLETHLRDSHIFSGRFLNSLCNFGEESQQKESVKRCALSIKTWMGPHKNPDHNEVAIELLDTRGFSGSLQWILSEISIHLANL